MIIPFENLESMVYYHSDYGHVHIDKYIVCDNKSNPPIFEVNRLGNYFDFENDYYHVTFEVFMGSYPEGVKVELPKNAKSMNQDNEPCNDEGDIFNCFAVFDNIEDAYKYAISFELKISTFHS